jgi:hypothetical protein
MTKTNPVEKLLTVFDSQSDIAAFCFVDRSAVTHWKNAGKIPPWHIKALSAYTSIPEWELCPESFVRVVETLKVC